MIGRRSPRQACGALVTARAAGETQTRTVDCRTADPLVHFGLAAAGSSPDLQITWPSGRSQTIEALQADRLHVIREPRS